MSVYAVSFDLKYDEGPNGYSARYDSLMAVIRSYPKVWDETTSFALVETKETIDAFEQKLWLSKFDSTKDKLLVIDVSYNSATCRGALKKVDILKSLLPGIVQK